MSSNVGHERGERIDLIGRDVDRTGEVGVGEVPSAEDLDERWTLSSGQTSVQVLT